MHMYLFTALPVVACCSCNTNKRWAVFSPTADTNWTWLTVILSCSLLHSMASWWRKRLWALTAVFQYLCRAALPPIPHSCRERSSTSCSNEGGMEGGRAGQWTERWVRVTQAEVTVYLEAGFSALCILVCIDPHQLAQLAEELTQDVTKGVQSTRGSS